MKINRIILVSVFEWALSFGLVVLTIAALVVLQVKLTSGAELPQPQTLTPQQRALVELGRNIFWDSRVSDDNTTSCASCHNPLEHGTTDNISLAVGKRNGIDQNGQRVGPNGLRGQRRSPPIINAALVEMLATPKMFLDHRAVDPIDQATMPMENPIEMGNQTAEQVARRLSGIAGYQSLCQAAFGSPTLTKNRMAQGLVAFGRRISAFDTPLNRYYQGDDSALSSDSAKHGAELFKRDCISCHKLPLYTTGECFDNGSELRFTSFMRSQDPQHRADIGLEQTTGNASDRRKFKTPSLVGVVFREFLNHNGQIRTLRDAQGNVVKTAVAQQIDHYAGGGRFVTSDGVTRYDPNTDPSVLKIAERHYTEQDKRDLAAAVIEGTTPLDWPTREEVGPPKEFPQ